MSKSSLEQQEEEEDNEWKVSFREEGAKLVQSLHKVAQEHLLQQEILLSGILERSGRDSPTTAAARRLQLLTSPGHRPSAAEPGLGNLQIAPSPIPSGPGEIDCGLIGGCGALHLQTAASPITDARGDLDPGLINPGSLQLPTAAGAIPDSVASGMLNPGAPTGGSSFGHRTSLSSFEKHPHNPTHLKEYLDCEMSDLTVGVVGKRAQTVEFEGYRFADPATALLETPRVGRRLHRLVAALQNCEEPMRGSRLARVVTSPCFEITAFVVIAAYGVFSIWVSDQMIPDPDVVNRPVVEWAEVLFLGFFMLELLLKLSVHRLYFFWNDDMWWNFLDFFLISFSLVEVMLNAFISTGSNLKDANFARTIRALRVGRSLRIIRAVRFISELRLLVNCIITSFSALIWCVLLLLLIQAGTSTALVQLVAAYHNERRNHVLTDTEQDELDKLVAAFGTVPASMMTLFKSTTGGVDWGEHYELIKYTGWVTRVIYLMYLLFFFIAAWNIITSLFMEKAMTLSRPDLETEMLRKSSEDLRDADEITSMLKDMDATKCGTINLPKFKRYMKTPRFRRFFELRDLEIKDAEMFFRMISAVSDSENVKLETFAHGCMRMKGYASSLDVQTLRVEVKTMYLNQTVLFQQVSEELKAIGDRVLRETERNRVSEGESKKRSEVLHSI